MRPGETIYKGHHSYDLMRQLQLGILFSIAKTPELRSQMQAAGQPSPCDFKYQASRWLSSRDRAAGLVILATRLHARLGVQTCELVHAANPASVDAGWCMPAC